MSCLICKDLKRVLQSTNAEYRCALAAPFFLVSTEIAARMQVDMERAKSALDEHLSSCRSKVLADDCLAIALSAGTLSQRQKILSGVAHWRVGTDEMGFSLRHLPGEGLVVLTTTREEKKMQKVAELRNVKIEAEGK